MRSRQDPKSAKQVKQAKFLKIVYMETGTGRAKLSLWEDNEL